MKPGFRWYDIFFILLFFYLFVLQLQAIWPFTIDDMYIPLRYAKHWSSGNGLLWNINEAPVEGYSNFSFVVLGALTLLFKANPVITLKITGVLGLLFTTYFIYLITRFWFAARESLLPCCVLLGYKGQIIWSASGLETTVYQACISGSVYFCLLAMGYHRDAQQRTPSQNQFFVVAGVLLALAGFTRPEAPALMILFFILICCDSPKMEVRRYWRGVLFFCITIALLYTPYFVWRLYYFGHLFPNPVYCKGISPAFNGVLDKNYLKLIWPFALLCVPACIHAKDKRHYFLWLPSVAYLLLLMGADTVVAFDNRLFLAPFVLLLPLALQGMSTMLLWYFQDKIIAYYILLYFLFLSGALLFLPTMSLPDYRYFSQAPVEGERLRTSVLRWLKTHARANDSVVLSDSGMIPYYSNLHFIDSYCLNNVRMAHMDINKRYEKFCGGVFDTKPAIIVLTSLTKQGEVVYTPADHCLKEELNHHSDYKLERSFSNSDSDAIYRYEVFTQVNRI